STDALPPLGMLGRIPEPIVDRQQKFMPDRIVTSVDPGRTVKASECRVLCPSSCAPLSTLCILRSALGCLCTVTWGLRPRGGFVAVDPPARGEVPRSSRGRGAEPAALPPSRVLARPGPPAALASLARPLSHRARSRLRGREGLSDPSADGYQGLCPCSAR